MDKLASIQAVTQAFDFESARNEQPTSPNEMLDEVGGELLQSSGFEDEESEPGFEEEEVF